MIDWKLAEISQPKRYLHLDNKILDKDNGALWFRINNEWYYID